MAVSFFRAFAALVLLTHTCSVAQAALRSAEDNHVLLVASNAMEPSVPAKPAVELGLKVRVSAYLKQGRQWINENALALIEHPVLSAAARMRQNSTVEAMTKTVTDAPAAASPGMALVNTLDVLILQTVITFVIVMLVGYLYTKNKPDELEPVPEGAKLDHFVPELFKCCDLGYFSLFTFCCPWVRWADSTRMLGELSFVCGIALWFLFYFLGLLFTAIVFWISIAILGTVYRQKMRTAFNMQNGLDLCCADWLTWCCCCCCAIAQEARQIEMAKVLKHSAVEGKELPLECWCV